MKKTDKIFDTDVCSTNISFKNREDFISFHLEDIKTKYFEDTVFDLREVAARAILEKDWVIRKLNRYFDVVILTLFIVGIAIAVTAVALLH